MRTVRSQNCPFWIRLSIAAQCLFMPIVYGQHPGNAMHPLMQDERLVMRFQLGDPLTAKMIEKPLAIEPNSVDAKLNLEIALPAPYQPVKVLQYLPRAQLQQAVSRDEAGAGAPAIELSVEGPTQSFRRWLVSGDAERDRLSSYIATWRFMSVATVAEKEELRKQFDTEFTRPPQLVVRGPGNKSEHRVSAEEGAAHSIDDPRCKINVRKFYPDYAMDRSSSEAVNRSARRRNPAALVDIEQNGVRESRWVFAKFPGFASVRTNLLPVGVQLDCAVEPAEGVPDFTIVAVGREHTELWARGSLAAETRPLSAEDVIPISGSPYKFKMAKFVPSAKLTESYIRDDKGKPAIEVEYAGKDGFARQWIEFGNTRTLATSSGPAMISLEAQNDAAKVGAHP